MISFSVIGPLLGAAALSYLMGSVNFAILVSRVYAKDDVRRYGSGNAGMTNILRTYGKLPAAITAAGDFSKAVGAVLLCRLLFGDTARLAFMDIGTIAGLFVMLGHVFPVFFGFKGGKGVLTCLGAMLTVNPLVFCIILVIFLPFVFIVKIVSLVSVIGAVCYPIITLAVLYFSHRPFWGDTLCAAIFAAIMLYTHRENIKRLRNGTEHRFGSAKK